MTIWSKERIAHLRELWANNRSASQIAAAIGEVSRNAVLGKVHRLGLPGRPSPIRRDGGGRRRRGKEPPMTTLREYARPLPALSAYSPRSTPAISSPPMPDEIAVTAPPVRQSAEAVPLPVTPFPPGGKQEGDGRPCQWILDRDVPKWPGRPRYCGAPAIFGESWCPEHRARVFIPKAERLVDKGRLERLAAAE